MSKFKDLSAHIPIYIIALGALKVITEIIEEGEKELLDFGYDLEYKDGKKKVIYSFIFKNEEGQDDQ